MTELWNIECGGWVLHWLSPMRWDDWKHAVDTVANAQVTLSHFFRHFYPFHPVSPDYLKWGETERIWKFLRHSGTGNVLARFVSFPPHSSRFRYILTSDGATYGHVPARLQLWWSNYQSYKRMLRKIGFTIPYSVETVYIAARTAERPLHREIERYLPEQPNRDAITWDQLKQHV